MITEYIRAVCKYDHVIHILIFPNLSYLNKTA